MSDKDNKSSDTVMLRFFLLATLVVAHLLVRVKYNTANEVGLDCYSSVCKETVGL